MENKKHWGLSAFSRPGVQVQMDGGGLMGNL